VLYKTISAAVHGIDANLIEVEVDIAPIKEQDPRYTTVGLPDALCARAASGSVRR
jgi:magnesium chelatase family protein